MEKNLIDNSELKEKAANTSIHLLTQNNVISENDYKDVNIEFAYLFSKDDGQIEALYKVTWRENVEYFAIQNGKLMNIKIDEDTYKKTTEYMKSYHKCLNEITLDETQSQKNRRKKNNSILKQKGIICNENLKCLSEDRTLKSLDDMCNRAIVSLLVIQVACDINNGNDVNKSLEIINPIIDKFGVRDAMNSKEKRIMDGTYSNQDCYDMDWAYEAYWSVCWILGLVDDISDGGCCCDCDKAIQFVQNANSFEEFKMKCKVRDISEILDMEDLYFRYCWAINEKKVNPTSCIGNLNEDNVIERRRGLAWALSNEADWYNIQLNA